MIIRWRHGVFEKTFHKVAGIPDFRDAAPLPEGNRHVISEQVDDGDVSHGAVDDRGVECSEGLIRGYAQILQGCFPEEMWRRIAEDDPEGSVWIKTRLPLLG